LLLFVLCYYLYSWYIKAIVRFLELSGVGRIMADGTDEDAAYAARLDGWIAWETAERVGDG
jgi:hypothetical protein